MEQTDVTQLPERTEVTVADVEAAIEVTELIDLTDLTELTDLTAHAEAETLPLPLLTTRRVKSNGLPAYQDRCLWK